MNKTQIVWVRNPDGSQGYTWNPITGCLNGCEYCYARKLANTRQKERYLANTNLAKPYPAGYSKGHPEWDPFYPRFWEDRCYGGLYTTNYPKHGKSKGIFTCDMSDLFGIGIPEEWTNAVLTEIMRYPWHRFYLLTKQPQNLIKFSPFPDNCRVGVTATTFKMFAEAMLYLSAIEAKVRYVSFEPLLDRIGTDIKGGYGAEFLADDFQKCLDWVIIGALTGTLNEIKKPAMQNPNLTLMPYGKKWTLQPKIEWVQENVEACDEAGVKVFLKDNLKPLFQPLMRVPNMSWWGNVFGLRQEMPEGR